MQILYTILFIGFSWWAQGQSKASFVLDAGGAFDSGWWSHSRGSQVSNATNDQGWDASRSSGWFGGGLAGLVQINQWKTGVSFNYSAFIDTRIRSTGPNPQNVRISEGSVKYYELGVVGEYDLFQKKRYTFSPHVTFGTFWINTLHPDRDNFGAKLFWEIGFNNQININQLLSIIIRPRYEGMAILLKEPEFEHESHRMYRFGLYAGLRFNL